MDPIENALTRQTGRPWRYRQTEITLMGTRVAVWTDGEQFVEQVVRPSFTHWVVGDNVSCVSVDHLAGVLVKLAGGQA